MIATPDTIQAQLGQAFARATPNGQPLPPGVAVEGDPEPSTTRRGPDVLVQLSPQAPVADPDAAQTAQEHHGHDPRPNATPDDPGNPPAAGARPQAQGNPTDPTLETKPNGQPLTEEEQKQLDELKQRDREVRQHEQAHKAAAGPYARGGPTYEFQTGPDGKKYAVGGSVQIDTSEVPGNPQATIQKMQVIRRAASAPAQPSAQDRAVAAEATRKAQKARQELQKQQAQEARATNGSAEHGLDPGSGPTAGVTPATHTDRVPDAHATERPRISQIDDRQPQIGRLVNTVA